MELLIEHSAPVDATDSNGNTALIFGAHGGHLPLVQLLLQRGAPVEMTNKDGLTPLQAALLQGHSAIVAAIAQYGAEVEEQASLAAIKALPPLPQLELPSLAEPPYPELPHFPPPELPEPLAGAPPAANAYDVAEGDAYTRAKPPKPTAAASALPRRQLQRPADFLQVRGRGGARARGQG